ncbi:MAG: mechanosensitive ion channel [Candidatus Hydrogenedentes bacterium]|nr:mechanosensitive ion channel [Candidatus Hydrogenedentota bacterium]
MTVSRTTRIALLHFALGHALLCALGAESAPVDTPPPTDPAAETRAKLREQLESYDQRIQQAEATATDEQAARIGVPIQELHDYALRLRETRSVFEEHVDALDAMAETRRSIAAAEAEIGSYSGLPDPPPYAPWVVDTYRDALDARTTQREIARRGVDQVKELAANASAELKGRQGDYAVANEKHVTNKDAAQSAKLEWAMQAAAAQRDLWQARVAHAQDALKLAEARLDLRDRELDLAERKQKDAESKEQYRPEDLEARRAELTTEREALEKERSAAEAQRDKTKKRLEEARTAFENSVEDEEYAVNQSILELRKVEAEAAQGKASLLREQMDTIYHLTEIWSARYSLHMAPKEFPLRQQRQRLQDYLDSLGVARRVQETREDVLRAEVRELSNRLARMQQSVNSLDNTQQFLKLRTGQLDQLAVSLAANDRADKLTQRVLAEIAAVEQRQSLGERLQQIGETAQMLWDKEIVNIDGQPLTLKKIGIALIILALGFAATRVLTRLVRRAFNARPHIDRTAAATIERVLHYGLLVMIVLFALSIVNIPLTVFTFFGGALAIGVGFGAQTLINNFISGMILMVERPIKIGDIVEVDGHRGLIAEIGARCSRVATFSGVDILVPNSAFLEKNVVNWTHGDSRARFSFVVKVAHETNTRDATRLIMKALEDHGNVLKTPGPSVLFIEFADNAFVFEVNFWLDLRITPDGRVVGSDLRHMIEHAFREAGIEFISPPKAPVADRPPDRQTSDGEQA